MSSKRPKPRRWRSLSGLSGAWSYELPCEVSARSAVVYPGSPPEPTRWAIYGRPAPQGCAIERGEENTLKAAKEVARRALDKLAAET